MSIESSLPIESTAPAAGTVTDRVSDTGFWPRVSAAVERAGEWLNPLLVKECRQALKSRQFALTFSLVLLLCWGWSIVGIARLGPDVPFRFDGPEMFYGYYLILAAPLLLIIPFSAFRSLIAEREDNTFELVAITTLRPRQIAGGKLGSAVLQMLVYFSAVAPCLAFTYLLRGVDVVTICFILYYTFLASVGFSLLTLFIASITKEKHWQIVVSVLLVIGLFYVFMGAATLCHALMRYTRLPVQEQGFWNFNGVLIVAFASMFALIYLAAGAQLTFPSENRSTPLRITMLVQMMLLTACAGYFAIQYGVIAKQAEALAVSSVSFMTFAAIYWYLMGAMMTGEAPELSPRVKRGLPQSDFGRLLFSWFNPGPGTGYFFAVCNLLATAALTLFGVWCWTMQSTTARGGPTPTECMQYILLLLGYVVIYLGVTHLLLRLLRHFTQVTVVTSLLINLIVLMAGWGIPRVIREMTDYSNQRPYTYLHLTDPFWSCAVTIDPSGSIYSGGTLVWLVLPVAAAVAVLCLIRVAPEIRQVRIAVPERVKEEDTALDAALHPPQHRPKNPWDE